MSRIKHLLSRMSIYSHAHHGGHMESSSLDPVTYADWPLDLIDPSMGTTADPGGWTPAVFEPVAPDGNYLLEVVA